MPPMMGMRRHPSLNKQKVDMKKNVGLLIKSFKRYYAQIILSFLCIAISVVLSILAPQYLSDLTNEITQNAGLKAIHMDKILRISIILITFYVSNAILTFISGFVMNTMTQKYCKDLRNDVTAKINRMKLKYFDNHVYGDTLSIITNDIDQIAQSMQQSITMLFQSILMLVGVFIAMFATSWQMALAALAAIPVVMIILMFIMKIALPLFAKRQQEV